MTEYDSKVPIYLQIIDIIKQNILSGKWKTGEKTPTVRELAVEFTVNPNTMQRALMELEREGLLYSERTSGRYVTTDNAVIDSARSEVAQKTITEFLQNMNSIGFSGEQIIELLRRKI